MIVTLTTASRHSDALVTRATAVHNSPASTSVVVRQRLRQRRVVEVRATMSAAIIVVAVETSIETPEP